MDSDLNSRRLVKYAGLIAATLLFSGSAAFADKGDDHQTQQTRPSFLGVSGSNINFLEIGGNSYCYTGTLGSLVNISGTNYILSNNHVLAKENTANFGDGVIQPGLLDENGDENSCSPAGTDYGQYIVGTLANAVELDFSAGGLNEVDAAVAQVANSCGGDCMDPQGRILDIGGLSGEIVAAEPGMAVQKSGRTTGHTTGTIGAVNVEVSVSYNTGTATFVNQILISGDKGAFLKSGDSGSLMVTRPTGSDLPNAVGLLFAGSRSGTGIANPIDAVLNAFAADMVACVNDCSNTGTVGGGGGGGGGGGKNGGGGNNGGGGGGRPFDVRGLDVATQARDSHRDALMANPDVLGTGIGADRNGNAVIQVYTRDVLRGVDHPIPSQLDGVKVQVIVTGEFRAF